MSGNDSEEKTLDPSDHKLRKAREKGQVAQSQDFVSASVAAIGLIYLAFAWRSVVGGFDDTLSIAISRMGEQSDQVLSLALRGMFLSVFNIAAPLLGIVLLVGIMANLIHKGGIPFSLHPIIPDFGRVNPGKAFEKIFSKRNATEFSISLVRMVIWFVFVTVLLYFFLNPILSTSMCREMCVLDQALVVLTIFMIAAIILMIFAGMADIPIQFSLFRHEQKMGQSELKREMKETQGTPEFKSHRKREHQSLVAVGGEGPKMTFVLDGGLVAVGMAFDMKTTPVPVVVSVEETDKARKLIAKARKDGIPVLRENNVVYDLARTLKPGQTIKQQHLNAVASVMVNNGLLKF